MTKDPDLEQLARDFMELWQEQVAAAATDPALAKWAEAWMTPLVASPARRAVTDAASRQGPRPLALHMTTSFAVWMSSLGALMPAKNGLLPWNESLSAKAAPIQTAVEAASAEDLARALHGETTQRMADFLAGVKAYRRHPYRRTPADPDPVWSAGNAKLRDYGGRGRPVLLVPSLINRAYILDLDTKNSLARYLRHRSWRPLLMDWDAPGEAEAGFDLDDYILGYLAQALAEARKLGDAPVPVVGYCMGGLLALALAQHHGEDVAGLALLATPWDFHGDRSGQAGLFAMAAPQVEAAGKTNGMIPVDVLQMMFASMSPSLIQAKFHRFAAMDPASDQANAFVALEDWLNDGVPLTGPVGRACLHGWYGENLPGRDRWTIGGEIIRPEAIDLPALVAIPRRDHIVPPESAQPLADRLPRAEVMTPAAGHIGMVVGRRAREQLWRPLDAWLRSTV